MSKEVKYDANGHRQYSMRDNLAYAAGDFGCNMSFALKGTMMIFGPSLWDWSFGTHCYW